MTINVTAISIIKALRPYQWVKNLLLFLPLFLAHQVSNYTLYSIAFIAFCSFSLIASAVYVLNDLSDIENDRAHPIKKNRPFAAGKISFQTGVFLIILLLFFGAFLASALPRDFQFVLAIYFLLTTLYSLFLKKIAILDVVVLASLYTVRIIAGGAATRTEISEWLLAFSLFIFFSLACLKRFSELYRVQKRDEVEALGRGYQASDLDQMAIFGSTSGYLSVLVLALYINSPAVTKLYQHPKLLWFLCPAVLYWITRIWLLARRGEVEEDPILFALFDVVSYGVLGIALLIGFFAT